MQEAASKRFDTLTTEKNSLSSRLDYINDELLKLQGEYRAYEAVATDLASEPMPPGTDASQIVVQEEPDESTAQ